MKLPFTYSQNSFLFNSHTNSVFSHFCKRPAPVTETFFDPRSDLSAHENFDCSPHSFTSVNVKREKSANLLCGKWTKDSVWKASVVFVFILYISVINTSEENVNIVVSMLLWLDWYEKTDCFNLYIQICQENLISLMRLDTVVLDLGWWFAQKPLFDFCQTTA